MELTGPDKKQLVNTNWLLEKSYLLDSAIPSEVGFLKDTVIGSDNYSIYSALPTGGDSLRLFFNSKTNFFQLFFIHFTCCPFFKFSSGL